MPIPDRDSKRTAKSVQNWLASQQFQQLNWHAQSLDLKAIQNLWAHLKRRLHMEYNSPLSNVQDLWGRIRDELYNVIPTYCSALVESLPRRMREVLIAKGLWAHF
ncbi:hypothetical protein QE152_g40782 [Popillia japonica]|uniref:Uncharacterized protein n=1 Tax=Popillia japonica TaxID=7064 RepID=A0AAW1HFI7_POPJA